MSSSIVPTKRKRMLDAFAACDPVLLSERYHALGDLPAAAPVRGPEIGMIMLRGRAGGGGAPFNLGEASVTRASVKLASGEVGHSLILGRNARKAQIVAHLDALAQRSEWAPRIEQDVVQPALAQRDAERKRQAEETEATRVDFFTMVRGED
ncbi:phosphonate C-P lyase system protein PhnG [Tianweitania sp. BSSL-BM11]|uniref:Phosphonate C-P lyase system protein PhnG n=1 Tax=Tianweitania aestuarii TaxID=2814886 RepID=A0ABS5RRF4_9HYPH|nr:phosphonate C-P lyase system protein PhnG [Tianweitania aestuarii]MBS9719542.1 phosphonate C-P lyase system protein PhnG [Tianweitania aestuarii]